jgi:hypothetical protein
MFIPRAEAAGPRITFLFAAGRFTLISQDLTLIGQINSLLGF